MHCLHISVCPDRSAKRNENNRSFGSGLQIWPFLSNVMIRKALDTIELLSFLIACSVLTWALSEGIRQDLLLALGLLLLSRFFGYLAVHAHLILFRLRGGPPIWPIAKPRNPHFRAS